MRATSDTLDERIGLGRIAAANRSRLGVGPLCQTGCIEILTSWITESFGSLGPWYATGPSGLCEGQELRPQIDEHFIYLFCSAMDARAHSISAMNVYRIIPQFRPVPCDADVLTVARLARRDCGTFPRTSIWAICRVWTTTGAWVERLADCGCSAERLN